MVEPGARLARWISPSLRTVLLVLPVLLLGIGALVLATPVDLLRPVHAEEEARLDAQLAEIAKLPGPDALTRLEKLLASRSDAAEVKRVRRALADRLVQEGNPYGAIEHFEILARGPDAEAEVRVAYAEALLLHARRNLATGNVTAAGVVPYLMDARAAVKDVKADPQTDLGGRLLQVRAQSWFYGGDLDKALEALDPAVLDVLPARFARGGYEYRAQVLYRKGEVRAAAAAFEKAGNPRGAAASWSAAKDAAKTRAAYLALLAQTPQDFTLLQEALSAVRYAGETEAFEKALGDAMPKDPAHRARYLIARADLRELVRDRAGAIGLLQEAAALDTSLVDPLVRIARIRLAEPGVDTGEARKRASTVLLEALRRDPNHAATVSALWYLAGQDYQNLWKSGGKGPALGRTLAIQQALVEAAPDDETAWANLGNTLRVGGRTEEALAAYEKARSENAYDPGIVSDHGLALSAAGRFEDALAAYLASTALDGSHLAGRQNAGRALWRLGRDDEAETELSSAIERARPLGRVTMTYRFLLDRVWRTRQDEALR